MSALPFGMNKKLSHRSRRLSGLARHRHHHPKSPQTLFKGSRVVYNLQRQQHSSVHLTGLLNPYRAMHEVLFFVEYPTVSSHLLPYIC